MKKGRSVVKNSAAPLLKLWSCYFSKIILLPTKMFLTSELEDCNNCPCFFFFFHFTGTPVILVQMNVLPCLETFRFPYRP